MSRLYLRRYTDLTSLIYMLTTKTITLLNPESWDDTNDSHYLSVFKSKSGIGSVLALCFTENDERYHYWRVFGNSPSGVCIQFNRTALLTSVRKRSDLLTKSVKYVKLNELREDALFVGNLPFIKRFAFEDEREYRLVLPLAKECTSLDISIPLSCINKVTLSPWLNANLLESVKKTVHGIDGCNRLKVTRSTLISNDEWKEFAASAT